MQKNKRPSFAFGLAAYNHQDYILEHLESIKYLVLTHGTNIDVDLIVNDDCSQDNTCNLVDQWLKLNTGLFRSVKTIYNPNNLGTCASVNNMLDHVIADRCKLSGGDDVYSFENIFELTQHNQSFSIISGRPLYLLDEELGIDKLSNGLATATQVIYAQDSLLHRFKHFSYNNAPNILYATDCLLHPNVRSCLKHYDVMEDWPLQVAIARQFPERQFELIDQVLVYYRRTAGSTYIVANERFVRDKIRMYDDLIRHETSWIEIVRLASRKFCFKANNRWLNKFLNLDLFYFSLSYLFRARTIFKKDSAVCIPIEKHRQHYAAIKSKAAVAQQKLV